MSTDVSVHSSCARSRTAHPTTFTGMASAQVQAVAEKISAVERRYPSVGTYTPPPIL